MLTSLRTEDPSRKILDVGCGAGTITLGLAAFVPEGHVTGLDLTDESVAPAREQAKQAGARNMSFVTGSALDLPFEDGTFDVVHASQTVYHLPDRERGIREMVRVCKVGGVVAVRDIILPSMIIEPKPARWEEWMALLRRHVDIVGGCNGYSGAELLGICLRSGLKAEQVVSTASCWYWTTPEDRKEYAQAWATRTTESEIAEWAVKEGIHTQQELQDMANGWLNWARKPEGWMAVINGEVLITKV